MIWCWTRLGRRKSARYRPRRHRDTEKVIPPCLCGQFDQMPLLLTSCFPDVDIAVKVLELVLRAAAVDGAADRFVDPYHIFAALAPVVFDRRLGLCGLQLDIKVAENLAVFRSHAQVGLDVRRESYVDLT